MGAFNNWVRGTSLEKPENRKKFAVTIAHTILKQVNLTDEFFMFNSTKMIASLLAIT